MIEWALDIFRALEDGTKSPLADGYVSQQADAEGRHSDEIRAALARHTSHSVDRARRELRELIDEALEPLLYEAFEMVRESLAALAIDRAPDFFSAELRAEARERPRRRAGSLLQEWLSVGRPRNQPLLPEEAREFVRLAGVGRGVFAGVRAPIDRDVLSTVSQSINGTLSESRERDAARGILTAIQRRAITGKDVQPKKLALKFAAKLVGVSGGIRTLQRLYDEAVKIAGTE